MAGHHVDEDDEYSASGGPHPRKRGPAIEDDHAEEEQEDDKPSPFMSAYDKMVRDNIKKNNGRPPPQRGNAPNTVSVVKKSLGTTASKRKFVSPMLNKDKDEESNGGGQKNPKGKAGSAGRAKGGGSKDGDDDEEDGVEMDERLKNVEPRMVEAIMNEIMDQGRKIEW
jgi:hypothetical protein